MEWRALDTDTVGQSAIRVRNIIIILRLSWLRRKSEHKVKNIEILYPQITFDKITKLTQTPENVCHLHRQFKLCILCQIFFLNAIVKFTICSYTFTMNCSNASVSTSVCFGKICHIALSNWFFWARALDIVHQKAASCSITVRKSSCSCR